MGLFSRRSEHDVDPAEARRLVSEEHAVLLDVREPAEWSAGHAPEAVHAPMQSLRREQFQDGRLVVAVCRSGNRSGHVVRQLLAAGIDARNLDGGMQAWARAGLPVVRDGGAPGTVA